MKGGAWFASAEIFANKSDIFLKAGFFRWTNSDSAHNHNSFSLPNTYAMAPKDSFFLSPKHLFQNSEWVWENSNHKFCHTIRCKRSLNGSDSVYERKSIESTKKHIGMIFQLKQSRKTERYDKEDQGLRQGSFKFVQRKRVNILEKRHRVTDRLQKSI